jgi:3-deoxy-D-manno-octulosonic-acid transferase
MWSLCYNIILILASPVIVLLLLAKTRCRRGLGQRLGFLPALPEQPGRPVLWVHAVSLGEAVAVAPLVRGLRKLCPEDRIIVSTTTETGREAVEKHLGDIAEHCYAPLDFPWVVRRVLRRLNPRAFLFIETEIWPNLLRMLHAQGVPAVLINGRISSRSFRGYRLIKPLIGGILGTLSLCLMQSERDAQRATALGARPDRVFRTGNIKFDRPVAGQPEGGPSRAMLGLGESEELIVAGSTHPVEEEEVLAAYHTLRAEFPSLVLLLAPRHIERAGQVEQAVRSAGLTPVLRTAIGWSGDAQGPGRVIILDTRGELAQVYGQAVLAFVGGTFVPVGGHNLLEPAGWGRPVFFGPYTDHCAEIAEQLRAAGGGIQVGSGAELAVEAAKLLRNRTLLQETGRAASDVITRNQGAVERTLELLGPILGKA